MAAWGVICGGGVICLPVTRIHHNNTQMTDGAALPDDRAMWQTGDSESPPPLQMDQMGGRSAARADLD